MVWVDSLAIWNPVMETEFYGDGQHNGGVYFWGNLNPYQNPIKFIDPNGKQVEWQKYWDQAKKQQDEKQHLILAFHRQYRTFADFGNLIPTISSHFSRQDRELLEKIKTEEVLYGFSSKNSVSERKHEFQKKP